MPSIITNAVLNPPKPVVKVELPAPAKTAERSQRGEGFEQMLRDVREKQATPAETPSKKAAAAAAEKSSKENKPKRAARADRLRKGEKSEAAEGEEESESADAAAEVDAAPSMPTTPEAEETTQSLDADQDEARATAKDGEKKDAAKLAEAAAEQGGCAVQAAGDATQQQRQSKNPQSEDDAPALAADAIAIETDDPPHSDAAAPVVDTATSDAAAQAATAASATEPATPTTSSPATAPTSQKPTVSAIGGASSVAIKPLGEAAQSEGDISLEGVEPTAADASAPLPPVFEWPADFEAKSKDASPLPANSSDKHGPELTSNPDAGSMPQTPGASKTEATQAAPIPREAQFADDNHEKIVTSVRTQLMPTGGTMRIRLDPPELGALQVMVEMRNGTLSATFQTSNDDATQLLSHSLNQLKHMLETQGMSVDKLQVQQAPKSEAGQGKGDEQQNSQQQSADEHAARQEQQRKQMLQRMWRRASGIADPIDFTA